MRLAMILGIWTAGSTALAGGLLQDRTAVLLCQESVDGTTATVCTLDATLLDWLHQEGARTVDAAQTERIRRQLATEQWQSPADLKGLDLVDADYAVVVTTRGSLQMNVGKMKSYLVQVAVRVVDVTRGVVLHAADLSGNGLGLNANAALLQGCTALWAQKKAQVRAGLEQALAAPATQDIWVYDVPDLATVTAVEQRLWAAAGVTQAKQTAFLKGVARWRVQLKPGADAAALARALEDGDSPLLAQGLTGGVLQLAWRPLARVKLPVRVTVKSAHSVPAWFGRAAAELAAQQLRSAGWLRLVEPPSTEQAVAVRVEVSRAAGGYVVKVGASRGAGAVLGAAVETGGERALPDLLQRALDRVVTDIRRNLERHPGEYAEIKRALAAPAALGAELLLDEGAGALRVIELDRWASHGLGKVKLSAPVDELTLRVRLGGGEWKPVPGAAHADQARLLLPVDGAALRALARATSMTLEAEVGARTGERWHRFALSRVVMVYPLRAMSWSQPDAYAAFIAPTAPWARALAVAHAQPREQVPTPTTARLAETWDALQSRGLRFVPDPAAPFGSADLDLVQLPTETLNSGGGDCDDLVAVVATAFEAAGAATVVLKAPRHVLLAVDTGLPHGAWPRFVASEKAAFNHGGRLFLPVEATAVGQSFWDAVQRGGARVATERDALLVLDPRTGWARSAPLEQPGNIEFSAAAEKPRIRVMVMTFAAPPDAAAAARRATRAAATALARNPALEVVTEEQVQDLATLSRAQMLSGCEAAECVSDLGRALAVRAMLTGRVELVAGRVVLQLALQDVVSMAADGAATVKAANADQLADALGAPVDGLAHDYVERRAPRVVASSAAAGAWQRVEQQVGKDPYARTRFLAFQGRLTEARAAAVTIPDPARRALAEGNIALLEGRLDEARVLLRGADAEAARLNVAFAQCAGTTGPLCSEAATGLSPLKVAALAGLAGDAAATVEGTDDGPEAGTRELARVVMDAAQGRTPRRAAGAAEPQACRWLLQW